MTTTSSLQCNGTRTSKQVMNMKTNGTNETMQRSKLASEQSSSIARFYEGKNVLVTGGSGFLGKVLIWKLVESCPKIGKIFVLLRPKNDTGAHKRLAQMLLAQPFNIQHDHASLTSKLVAIDSDITKAGLGLSESDRTQLIDQVNVVFHCAASVRFDAPLKSNMRDNFTGTQEIVKLCNQIADLSALVHVSTAYSNCNIKFIPESVVPLQVDVDSATQIIDSMTDNVPESVTSKLLEGRPNTYTYTKALAEHYVVKSEGKYPISIVRPSIVVSSAKEPCPGWVDNVNGLSGLSSLASIGLVRTIDWNYYGKSDIVPVDYVANCIICSALDVHVNSPKKVRIYNMTSGSINPVTWGGLFGKLRNEAILTPPSKIIRPMISAPKYDRANQIGFRLTKISELLFAYLVDMILVLFGFKRILMRMTRKMHHGYKVLEPFTINEWNFEVVNVMNLCNSLDASDKRTFNFDLRTLDWNEMVASVWTGVRAFILKDEPTEESYRAQLKRQKLVTVVHYTGLTMIIITFASLFAWASTSLLRNFVVCQAAIN